MTYEPGEAVWELYNGEWHPRYYDKPYNADLSWVGGSLVNNRNLRPRDGTDKPEVTT